MFERFDTKDSGLPDPVHTGRGSKFTHIHVETL